MPALLDQAEQALALVDAADDAEVLWRKVAAVEHAARLAKAQGAIQLHAGRLKLRAERRWGELLGPAERGGDTTASNSRLDARDYVARQRAREVAAVPPDVFDRYLTTVKDAEMLRRARLLRVARETQTGDDAIPEPVTAHGEVEIRHGDLRNTFADLEGQVDAIITDPPYPAEHLDEFDALGELAAKLLTPTGIAAVMVGQTHLPEYLVRLGRHLTYRWCGAYLTEGPATRVFGRKVGTKWKPILIYGGTEFLTQDVFTSRRDDKEHHHWGQSESGISDLVARLTRPGQLVVDPFLGGGTTALVCRELGRRFVGCDIDAAAVTTARERLAA